MLKPEFTQNTEAGVRFELQDLWWPKDRFHAGLTFFDIATKDYIYGSAGEFRNADEARFRGKEFNLGYDSGAFFARYGLTRYDRVSFCDAGGTTAAPASGCRTSSPTTPASWATTCRPGRRRA